jgi:hypothetical protein
MERDHRTKEYKMEYVGKIMKVGFIAVTIEQWVEIIPAPTAMLTLFE